jgi:hypothetical protein
MPNINFSSGTPVMLDGQGRLVEMVYDEVSGFGVVPGGVVGQLLVKKTSDDYEIEWLGQGDEGQVLTSAGAGATPTWETPSVSGQGSSAVKSYFMAGW